MTRSRAGASGTRSALASMMANTSLGPLPLRAALAKRSRTTSASRSVKVVRRRAYPQRGRPSHRWGGGLLGSPVLATVTGGPGDALPNAIFNPGAAVVLFFVLSGYVLGLSLRREDAPLRDRLGVYLWRRGFRLLLAMWASILLYALVLQLIASRPRASCFPICTRNVRCAAWLARYRPQFRPNRFKRQSGDLDYVDRGHRFPGRPLSTSGIAAVPPLPERSSCSGWSSSRRHGLPT